MSCPHCGPAHGAQYEAITFTYPEDKMTSIIESNRKEAVCAAHITQCA